MPTPSRFRRLADALARARPRLGRLGSPCSISRRSARPTTSPRRSPTRGDAEGAVVIADAQTAGRGRRGRDWFSPPGSGLYVSVVLDAGARARRRRSRDDAADAGGRRRAGRRHRDGDRAARSISSGRTICCVGRRKLAGILAEASPAAPPRMQHVVLGYGINVGAAAYPPELRSRDVARDRARPPGRSRVAAAPRRSRRSRARYDDLLAGRFDAILDAWRAPRAAAAAARASRGTTPAGAATGMTAGIDDAARCSCGSAIASSGSSPAK